MRPAIIRDRHPLAIDALGDGFARFPVSFLIGLMVFGATDPRIIGELVVVHCGIIG